MKHVAKSIAAANGSTPEGEPSPACRSFQDLGRIRVTGEISIDIEAESFAQAAAEQERLEKVMRIVREQFPKASLRVRERRRSRKSPSQVAPLELQVDRPFLRPRSTS